MQTVNSHLLAEFALMDWVHKKGSRSSRLSYLVRTQQKGVAQWCALRKSRQLCQYFGADALTANDRHHCIHATVDQALMTREAEITAHPGR